MQMSISSLLHIIWSSTKLGVCDLGILPPNFWGKRPKPENKQNKLKSKPSRIKSGVFNNFSPLNLNNSAIKRKCFRQEDFTLFSFQRFTANREALEGCRIREGQGQYLTKGKT